MPLTIFGGAVKDYNRWALVVFGLPFAITDAFACLCQVVQ